MKLLITVLLFASLTSAGQWKSYLIGVKGDTLNRIDKGGKKQGPWVAHFDELRGEPGFEEEGFYKNDKKEGPWRKYSLVGDLLAVENYRWGNKDGKNAYFINTGQVLREENWKAVNPDNPYDTVDIFDIQDPTRVIERRLVKLEGYSLKHGLWTFYDPSSGRIEKTEKWYLDKPAVNSGDGDLAPLDVADNSKAKSDTIRKYPKPQAIVDFEKKKTKKKNRVRDGQTGY